MIYGVGCDVVELERVARVMQEREAQFVARILTEQERQTYSARNALSRARGLAFVASRWAAKEAISKALGTGIRGDVSFQAIEIGHMVSGAPVVSFHSPLKERLAEQGIVMHVSLTDEKSVVAAFAVAEKF